MVMRKWRQVRFYSTCSTGAKSKAIFFAETETRIAVFVARRPSVRARMASCPFDDPPSWWMVKKCVPDQKIVTRWEGDGEEAYEVPLPVEVQSFLAMFAAERNPGRVVALSTVKRSVEVHRFIAAHCTRDRLLYCCSRRVHVVQVRQQLTSELGARGYSW